MRYLRICSYAYVAILMTGCTTTLPSMSSVDPSNLANHQSIVVFSTSSVTLCPTHLTTISLKPEAGNPYTALFVNNPRVPSDFEDEFGKVFAIPLPPGRYTFQLGSANAFINYRRPDGGFYDRADPNITEPFELRPQEIRYVGELAFAGCGTVSIDVHDKQSRDLGLLATIDPRMRVDDVSVELVRRLR